MPTHLKLTSLQDSYKIWSQNEHSLQRSLKFFNKNPARFQVVENKLSLLSTPGNRKRSNFLPDCIINCFHHGNQYENDK